MHETNKDEYADALDRLGIMLSRIYDLLMILADEANSSKRAQFEQIHEQGGLVGPPPGYDPEFQARLDAQ